MNAIQANERLTILLQAIQGINRAIEAETRRQDLYTRHGLKVVLKELEKEAEEIKQKLENISI